MSQFTVDLEFKEEYEESTANTMVSLGSGSFFNSYIIKYNATYCVIFCILIVTIEITRITANRNSTEKHRNPMAM